MRSPPVADVHNLHLCHTCDECLGDTGHLRGLVSDALVVNVVFCKKGLQIFLCRRGADGLVEDRNGATRLTPELKVHERLIFGCCAKILTKTAKIYFHDTNRAQGRVGCGGQAEVLAYV
jgi:hypothetical protein